MDKPLMLMSMLANAGFDISQVVISQGEGEDGLSLALTEAGVDTLIEGLAIITWHRQGPFPKAVTPTT